MELKRILIIILTKANIYIYLYIIDTYTHIYQTYEEIHKEDQEDCRKNKGSSL